VRRSAIIDPARLIGIIDLPTLASSVDPIGAFEISH
jgi:hypothetical protein